MNLIVRVNHDLALHAGIVEEVDRSELVIHPPTVSLFHQVLGYLRAMPDQSGIPEPVGFEDEGLAAAAVALRWGSYLAVLADSAKPIWTEARSGGTSRISDSEMARINIETSAALAEWVDIAREDRGTYERLVRSVCVHLPLPNVRPNPTGSDFAMLAMPEVAAKVIAATGPDRVARVRADADAHASRIFANALVNVAWRNGPVETIHAGTVRGYPVDRRRVTITEERDLVGFATDRLMTGMGLSRDFTLERSGRSWSEQVAPYGLAGAMLITPSGWTLTEVTREVRLPR